MRSTKRGFQLSIVTGQSNYNDHAQPRLATSDQVVSGFVLHLISRV